MAFLEQPADPHPQSKGDFTRTHHQQGHLWAKGRLLHGLSQKPITGVAVGVLMWAATSQLRNPWASDKNLAGETLCPVLPGAPTRCEVS